MNSERIQWYAENEKRFNELGQEHIRPILEEIDDETFEKVRRIKIKDSNVTLALSILFGYFGADRFYLKDKKMGMVKIFTLGGMLIMILMDIISSKRRTKAYNTLQFFKTIKSSDELIELVKEYNKKDIKESYIIAKAYYDGVTNDPNFKKFKEGFREMQDSGYAYK